LKHLPITQESTCNAIHNDEKALNEMFRKCLPLADYRMHGKRKSPTKRCYILRDSAINTCSPRLCWTWRAVVRRFEQLHIENVNRNTSSCYICFGQKWSALFVSTFNISCSTWELKELTKWLEQGRRNGGALRGHCPPAFSKGGQRGHSCPYITVS